MRFLRPSFMAEFAAARMRLTPRAGLNLRYPVVVKGRWPVRRQGGAVGACPRGRSPPGTSVTRADAHSGIRRGRQTSECSRRRSRGDELSFIIVTDGDKYAVLPPTRRPQGAPFRPANRGPNYRRHGERIGGGRLMSPGGAGGRSRKKPSFRGLPLRGGWLGRRHSLSRISFLSVSCLRPRDQKYWSFNLPV